MAKQPIFMVSVLGVALLLPVELASAQAKPPVSVTMGVEKSSAGRIIAPKDKLKIDVAGPGGFQGAAEVQEDGLIFFPDGGSVRAKGRTPSELADQIAKVLKDGGLAAEPVGTVEIIQVEIAE